MARQSFDQDSPFFTTDRHVQKAKVSRIPAPVSTSRPIDRTPIHSGPAERSEISLYMPRFELRGQASPFVNAFFASGASADAQFRMKGSGDDLCARFYFRHSRDFQTRPGPSDIVSIDLKVLEPAFPPPLDTGQYGTMEDLFIIRLEDAQRRIVDNTVVYDTGWIERGLRREILAQNERDHPTRFQNWFASLQNETRKKGHYVATRLSYAPFFAVNAVAESEIPADVATQVISVADSGGLKKTPIYQGPKEDGEISIFSREVPMFESEKSEYVTRLLAAGVRGDTQLRLFR